MANPINNTAKDPLNPFGNLVAKPSANNFGVDPSANGGFNPVDTSIAPTTGFSVVGNGRAVGATPEAAVKKTYLSDMRNQW